MIDTSKIETVSLVIFQPRHFDGGDSSEWQTTTEYLKGEFADKCRVAVIDSEQALEYASDKYLYDNGLSWQRDWLKPSEKGCKWCRAKSNCPALATAMLEPIYEAANADGFMPLDDSHQIVINDKTELADGVKQAIANIPKLSFNDLARAYNAKKALKEWIEAIEERMLSEMMHGVKHPAFKLIKGRAGNRKWRDAEEAEEAMKAMRLKVDEMYDKTVISPTSAEKLLKDRPRLLKKLEGLVTRSEGSIQIAPMSSKAEEYDPLMSFDVIEDEPEALPEPTPALSLEDLM